MTGKGSPEYVRLSLAAAMTLGFKDGRFYRDARSPCVNLLLTYDDGCAGSCAYCGLSQRRPGAYAAKSFIRVRWDAYALDDVTDRMASRADRVRRVCISMVTRRRAVDDTLAVARKVKAAAFPISALVSPTVLRPGDFADLRAAGVERVGVAVDAATPALFARYRGGGVGGPHRWERYWEAVDEAIRVFGRGMVGVHLIVGLGETEREMAALIQDAHDRGAPTHLFSFFPEEDSALANRPQPPAGQYRRIQLARYLINDGVAPASRFAYDAGGRITDFGVAGATFAAAVESGEPFMTSGCPGDEGAVACNRPYSDSLPGPDIRNYPFRPEGGDITKIKKELDVPLKPGP
jgi:biotin synthase